MKQLLRHTLILLACISSMTAYSGARGQSAPYQSQEVSEVDGVPVLVKHLPDWQRVREQTKLTPSIEEVRRETGNSPVLSGVEMAGGAEAAIADYPEGRLVLIEYPSPQGSKAADEAIGSRLPETPGVVYRRIGNYNALFFNVSDAAAANGLLDQIKYQKTVQWLGEDPYMLQRFERYIANTGRDVAISTVLFIVGIFVTAILLGVAAGYAYFRFREQERAHRTAFSDAGGLTRLNLDELSE